MKSLKAFLALLTLLLASCAPGNQVAGTPTPSGPAGNITEWKLWDPMDPAAPALIEKGTSGFRLKPGWEAQSIEYLSGWWGLGTPGLDYQQLKREGDVYKLGDTSLSKADVSSFLKAIDHLYPTQTLVGGNAWTDDYPSWKVEIAGVDGQHILVSSTSTGNPGNGPWNVLYNGRLYAQYDGTLGGAIGRLFGGRLASSDSDPFPGSRPQNIATFGSAGLPEQLVNGFWGLLPISSGFGYSTDAKSGELSGQITGSSRIGSMKIGKVEKLHGVELATAGDKTLKCSFEQLPEGDPFTAQTAWKFTCRPDGMVEGKSYRLPIKVSFETDDKQTAVVEGQLWGVWGIDRENVVMTLPPPSELAAAIPQNESARDLLTDHVLMSTDYSAMVDSTVPMSGTLNGEALLLGQTQVEGKPVRYTIGTRFAVKDGKLDYWSLDRTALNTFVKTVGELSLTHRVLAADPSATISLWYAKGTPPDIERSMVSSGPSEYALKVNPCGSAPGGIFPSDTQPLQAFGYNSRPNLWMADFALIDGKPVAAQPDLSPLYNKDPARNALMPEGFDTGTSRAFARVWLQTDPMFSSLSTSRPGDKPQLVPGDTQVILYIPEDATAEEKAVYERVARAFPGDLNIDEGWWTLSGVTFAVTDSGELKVEACKK
jgi:hypothetical protein